MCDIALLHAEVQNQGHEQDLMGCSWNPGTSRSRVFLEHAQQCLPAALNMIKTNLVPFMMEEKEKSQNNYLQEIYPFLYI